MTSPDLSSLRSRFSIPGTLSFAEQSGLIRLDIATPAAQASMYLQGAHLAHWQPAGQDPVLFMSRQGDFVPGKALRGGIPIAFPWFASDSKRDRIDGHPGPSHGFARIQDWTLESAQYAGQRFELKLSLGPTTMSRAMGFDHFLLSLHVSLGDTLTTELSVANRGAAPIEFEEAFHNYFQITDVHEATVHGLEPTPYLDKTDGMKLKPASGGPIVFAGPVDRVYNSTDASVTIRSGSQRREIQMVKSNSSTTVVWNPGKALPDLGEWDWHEMLCVETVNAGVNARVLSPGESFTMGQRISVRRTIEGGGGSSGPSSAPPAGSQLR